MAMLATAGPMSAARLGESTSRSSGGSKARPAVSTSPTSKLAINAPRTEPMPPMTITTSAQALSVEEAYDILQRSYVDKLPRAAQDAPRRMMSKCPNVGGEKLPANNAFIYVSLRSMSTAVSPYTRASSP